MQFGAVDYGGGSVRTGRVRTISVADLRGLQGPLDAHFTLTAQHATVRLSSGRTVDALTFNGSSPGPELRVHQGDLVEVTLANKDVDEGVTIHWHGVDVPNAEDGVAGVTQDAVRPGETYTYRFRADQAGTFWYHTHQSSAHGVERGLFGALVILPAAQQSPGGLDLALVAHDFDGAETLDSADLTARRAVGSRDAGPAPADQLRQLPAAVHAHRDAVSGRRDRRHGSEPAVRSHQRAARAGRRRPLRPGLRDALGPVALAMPARPSWCSAPTAGEPHPRRGTRKRSSTSGLRGAGRDAFRRVEQARPAVQADDRPQARPARRRRPGFGGRSTEASTRTCRCSSSTAGDVVRSDDQQRKRECTRCTCTGTTPSSCPGTASRATGSPWWSTHSSWRRRAATRSRSSRTTRASGWTTATTSATRWQGSPPPHLCRGGEPYQVGGAAHNHPE